MKSKHELLQRIQKCHLFLPRDTKRQDHHITHYGKGRQIIIICVHEFGKDDTKDLMHLEIPNQITYVH